MERFEFTPTKEFKDMLDKYYINNKDLEKEIKNHIIFNIDVVWDIENWSLLNNGNIEVFINIR